VIAFPSHRCIARVARVAGAYTALVSSAAAILIATPRHAFAQGRPVVAEGDAEVRAAWLRQLWDAAPGSDEGRTGMSFNVWLAEQSRLASALAPTGLPGRWTSIGPLGFYGDNGFFGSLPQLDAGRVPTVAFHPTNRGTIFVGTSAGGVWRTTNEGASWTPVTDALCSLVIGSVAIDPVNPQVVYAATGEPSEGTEGCGILRSTDGGDSWATLGASFFGSGIGGVAARFYSLVVDRASAGTPASTILVGATNGGIVRSADGGGSWTLSVVGNFSDVVQHPTNATVFFAVRRGLSTSAGTLFRSRDRGVSWSPVSSFDPGAVGRIEMAVSAAAPGDVWMVASTLTSAFGGLFRYSDATETRTTLVAAGVTAPPAVAGRNNFGTQGNYDLMIAVDHTNPSRIFLGGVRAYRSIDGGASFTEIAANIHCDWHTIVVDPSDPRRVLAGSDGGLFLSRDGGDTFLAINAGLATTLHYPGLSLHPTDPSGVLTGMQDNGTILARNGIAQYTGIFGGDGAYTAINPTTPELMYVSSQNGNLVRVDARTGQYFGITGGIDASERRSFIAPFVIDAARPTRLYFGGARLYRTSNQGGAWTAISPDLTRGTGVITAIAVAPSDTTRLYVGTSDANVRFSTDFGVTWTAPTTVLPTRSVGDISVDPSNAARAVVTFTSTGSSHVFLTTDGGLTWTSIGTALPDVTTQASAWGPAGRLYVGNMLGVYESADLGASWTRMGGLPTVRVTDLVYNATTNRLVAATYGRGLWAFDFSTGAAVLRGDVNADGSVNAADALVIQRALVGLVVQPSVQLFPRADANCDGRVDILDATLVLRFAVGAATGGACVGTVR
jgi:hypothetical protein